MSETVGRDAGGVMTRRLCGIDRDGWGVTLEFKPEDCWMGVFWRTEQEDVSTIGLRIVRRDWWICLVPMLPIHISIATVARRAEPWGDDAGGGTA